MHHVLSAFTCVLLIFSLGYWGVSLDYDKPFRSSWLQIEHCLKTSEPLTLSLGENIGTLKVDGNLGQMKSLKHPSPQVRRKTAAPSR